MKHFKTHIQLFLFSLLVIISTSCEKIIEIDTANHEPKLVLEATMRRGDFVVLKASMTTGFYESRDDIKYQDVDAVLECDGVEDHLVSTERGLYHGVQLIGQWGKSYKLTVQHEGTTYTAVTTMPNIVPVIKTSISYEKSMFDDHNDEDEDDGYYTGDYKVSSLVKDIKEVENFYQVLYSDVDGYYNTYKDLSVRNDDLFNGNEIELNTGRRFEVGEVVNIEIRCIDEVTYDYLSALKETQNSSGGPMGETTPYNPVGNFGEEVLGYFGTYTSEAVSVKIVDLSE